MTVVSVSTPRWLSMIKADIRANAEPHRHRGYMRLHASCTPQYFGETRSRSYVGEYCEGNKEAFL